MEAIVGAILQRQENFGQFILQSRNRVVISKRDEFIYLATWINANFAGRFAAEVRDMIENAHAIVNVYINQLNPEEIKKILRGLINGYARYEGFFNEDELNKVCSALLLCMSHRSFSWFNRAPDNITNTVSILLEACNIFDQHLPLFSDDKEVPSIQLLTEKSYLLKPELYDQWYHFIGCNSYEDGIDLQSYDFTTPCIVEINNLDSEGCLNIRLYSYDNLKNWVKVSNKSSFNRQQLEIYKVEDGFGDFKKNILMTPEELIEYLLSHPAVKVKIL